MSFTSVTQTAKNKKLSEHIDGEHNTYVIAFAAARVLSSRNSSQLYFTLHSFSHPLFPNLMEIILVWHLMCVDVQSSWSWLAEKAVSGH